MGLDTYFYYYEETEFVNPKTNERITHPSCDCEYAYFRKNYCLMEWFAKHWGFDAENCVNYLVDKEDVKALLADCQLAIDLVDEAVGGREIELCEDITEIPDDVEEQLEKLFPMKSWRAVKSRYNSETKKMEYPTPRFDGNDYHDVKYIITQFKDVDNEYIDKFVLYNNW